MDCHIQPTIYTAPYVDLTKLDGPVDGLGKDEKLLLVCSTGKQTYLVQNLLRHYGYTNTKVLEGGTMFSPAALDNK